MRLTLNVNSGEVAIAILWFKHFCGAELERRISIFESEGSSNQLLKQYYRETFKLEYSIANLIRTYRPGQPLLVNPALSEAYNFVVAFVRIYEHLSSNGKKRFTQDLQNSFTQVYGMRPLAFELTPAIHFLRNGCDVNFVDIEGLERWHYDYLVEKDGQQFEVECKAVSDDAGRVIDRKGLCKIGQRLLPIVESIVDYTPRVLTIKIRSRLDNLTEADIGSLCSAAREALSGIDVSPTPSFVMSVQLQSDLKLPPTVTNDGSINKFVRDKVGGLGKHILIRANRASGNVICIVIESETADDVIGKVSQRAAQAGEQLSRQRPSMVAIQIADMPPSSLHDLSKTRSGVHAIAEHLFEGLPRRPHVNAVAFSALPLPEEVITMGPNISNMAASVLMLRNPAAKFPCAAIENGNPFSV